MNVIMPLPFKEIKSIEDEDEDKLLQSRAKEVALGL